MTTSYPQIAGQNVERLAALSDGIFAVAMTLLVLDLAVHGTAAHHGQHPLWTPGALGSERAALHVLAGIAPKLVPYAMSFMTLAIFWVGQQTQLNHFERVNRPLTLIHLAFLAAVVLMPFSTGFLSTYLTFRSPFVVYWLNLLLMGSLLYASIAYAERARAVPGAGHQGGPGGAAPAHLRVPVVLPGGARPVGGQHVPQPRRVRGVPGGVDHLPADTAVQPGLTTAPVARTPGAFALPTPAGWTGRRLPLSLIVSVVMTGVIALALAAEAGWLVWRGHAAEGALLAAAAVYLGHGVGLSVANTPFRRERRRGHHIHAPRDGVKAVTFRYSTWAYYWLCALLAAEQHGEPNGRAAGQRRTQDQHDENHTFCVPPRWYADVFDNLTIANMGFAGTGPDLVTICRAKTSACRCESLCHLDLGPIACMAASLLISYTYDRSTLTPRSDSSLRAALTLPRVCASASRTMSFLDGVCGSGGSSGAGVISWIRALSWRIRSRSSVRPSSVPSMYNAGAMPGSAHAGTTSRPVESWMFRQMLRVAVAATRAPAYQVRPPTLSAMW